MVRIPFACTCGYGCGTELALNKHLMRFPSNSGHARGVTAGSTLVGDIQKTSDANGRECISSPVPYPQTNGALVELSGVSCNNVSNDDVCRFCLDKGDEPLLSVCACRGSGQWLHMGCLKQWMISAQTLVNHPSEIAKEQRHLTCSVCNERFRGVQPPSRLDILAELAQFDAVNIKEGMVIRYANVFPAPQSEDPAAIYITGSKRKHFDSSVYLIFKVQGDGADTNIDDDSVFAVNLVRDAEIVWGSDQNNFTLKERTCGNIDQSQLDEWRRQGFNVKLFLGGPIMPAKPVIALLISHSVPGGFEFGDVGALVAQAQAMAHSSSSVIELRIFLGQAKWSRSQLLGEIARGSWGVLRETGNAIDWNIASESLWHDMQASNKLYCAPPNPMREDYYRRAGQR